MRDDPNRRHGLGGIRAAACSIGLARSDEAASVFIAGLGGSPTEGKTECHFGIGATHAFNKAVEGVIEWKWIDTAKVRTATVGASYPF
jgi:hypothetical protein